MSKVLGLDIFIRFRAPKVECELENSVEVTAAHAFVGGTGFSKEATEIMLDGSK